MAVKVFYNIGNWVISSPVHPKNQDDILGNSFKISIWGTMSSGGTALVSFVFSRYLIQNEPWKSIAPHVVKAALWSCGTYAAVGTYIIYRYALAPDATNASIQLINTRVSLFAKASALVGLIGAAAAALATHYVQESSLAKHSFVLLLGLGTAGSILWIFTHRQNKQLDTYNRNFFEQLEVPDGE